MGQSQFGGSFHGPCEFHGPLTGAPGGGSVVALNVYDLGEGWLRLNNLFSEVLPIGGAFHTGLEAYGLEWSFGREGISCVHPRCNHNHVYRETIDVGFTNYSPQQIALILQEMVLHWSGYEYDVLKTNCCSFCRELSKRLCGNDIPAWVDRFAQFGNLVSSPAGRALGMNFSQMLEGDDEDESPGPIIRHPPLNFLPQCQVSMDPSMLPLGHHVPPAMACAKRRLQVQPLRCH